MSNIFQNIFPNNATNQNNIFNPPQNNTQKADTNILFGSSLFKNNNNSFFNQNIQNNQTNNLFGFQTNKSDENKTKEKNDSNPSQINIFGVSKNQIENSKANENKPTLFQSNIVKKNLFENTINENNEKPKNENNVSLFANNKEKINDKENIEKKKEEKNEEKGSLFGGIFDKKNEDKSKNPFLSPISEDKNSFFNSNLTNDKNQIKKNLFQKDNNKNEEDRKEEEKKEIKIENNNKEKDEKEKNIFEMPKMDKIGINIPKKDEKEINEIDTSSKINNLYNQNSLSSSKSLEDNEDIQLALINLYVSDVLLPNKSFNPPPLYDNENQKNNIKMERPIDFNLIVEIEGNTNINDEGFNMICQSNETMANLLKQVKRLIKRKYKMFQDFKDFEIFLIKNEEKLPINERELIGKNIKNKDNIIVSIIHHNSDKINEMKELKEKSEKEKDDEKEEEEIKKNNNNILCPEDKLPILTKPGNHMNPNEYIISRMTIDEIQNVKDFEIYNENGKIHFDVPISLYGVNFDKLFNIKHDLIEYEKDEWCHSPRGKNFNIPATITLYNIKPNFNISNMYYKNQFLQFLNERCKKNLNGTFLSYDFKSGELKFKTPYFY